jgi:mannose-6-phosphate isomerase
MVDIISKQVNSTKKVEKPWGGEIIIADNELYTGKLLCIKKGCRTSLQYHKEKDETFYISSGKVLIEIGDTKITPSCNEAIRIRPGIVHRITAIESSVVFEVSTPHKGTVRLGDDYGRQDSSG